MDVNLMRVIFTVLSFTIFIGICWWAYSKTNRERFDEAARIALEDDPLLEHHLQQAQGEPS